eukprot:m.58839 g.58839  ORF g.58839 m.58839 type:complete len:150 (-) comp13535_c0_seq1:462-911(-)
MASQPHSQYQPAAASSVAAPPRPIERWISSTAATTAGPGASTASSSSQPLSSLSFSQSQLPSFSQLQASQSTYSQQQQQMASFLGPILLMLVSRKQTLAGGDSGQASSLPALLLSSQSSLSDYGSFSLSRLERQELRSMSRECRSLPTR